MRWYWLTFLPIRIEPECSACMISWRVAWKDLPRCRMLQMPWRPIIPGARSPGKWMASGRIYDREMMAGGTGIGTLEWCVWTLSRSIVRFWQPWRGCGRLQICRSCWYAGCRVML